MHDLRAVISIGRIQELPIIDRTKDRLIIGDDDEQLILHSSSDPSGHAESLQVFVYEDRNGRKAATTKLPKAEVGGFAYMRVLGHRGGGAIVEWGIEPHLLVPHEEQERALEAGRFHVVRVYLDEETGRIQGSTRIRSFLDNDHLTVGQGDAVDLLIHGRSDLGYSVVVNGLHHGLLHANDVFKPVSVGDRLTGYVKTVRPDNKLDITLQPIGYRQYIDGQTTMVAQRIQARNGFLALTDRSSADEIHAEFGFSKKVFKRAIGALYKARLVRLEEDGVRWIG
ncbi:MAG: GntR family transcriptional regulator [Flavobacteriales bacterium]|jgi:hypothetical protein|nr:GntR family transcriptional regulator [Flavobacteriales bacterium]